MIGAPPLLLALLVSLPAAGEPDKPDGPVSYHKHIRPLIQLHCQGCHQPAKAQGAYIMTGHAALLKKGDRERSGVIPGQPDKSLVIEMISPNMGKRPEMPRGAEPLPETEVALIRRWIAEGAKDDTPPSTEDKIDAEHPPVYPAPPGITALEFSPDGSLLAVSGYHEVLLHKADGSELVGRLVGLSERIQSLAFSPDGKSLATAGGSPARFGEVQIWDVEKRKLRQSVPVTHDTVYGISWSPDGSRLAFGCSDNTLRAIDTNDGKQVLYQGAHTDWVLGTVFSRDGLFLASIGRDRTIKLTEVETQRFIDNITSITPGALKGGLSAVALRPQKELVKKKYTGAGIDAAEKVYEELLIGGSDGVPRLYKMHRETKRVIGDDANKIREYPGLPGRIFALAFSADGNLFAAGSSLDREGAVRVYSTQDGKQIAALEGKVGPVYTLAFSPDGKTVAAGGFDGTVCLFDPTTGKRIKEFVPVPLAAGK